MKWEIRLWYGIPDVLCNLKLGVHVLRAVF